MGAEDPSRVSARVCPLIPLPPPARPADGKPTSCDDFFEKPKKNVKLGGGAATGLIRKVGVGGASIQGALALVRGLVMDEANLSAGLASHGVDVGSGVDVLGPGALGRGRPGHTY